MIMRSTIWTLRLDDFFTPLKRLSKSYQSPLSLRLIMVNFLERGVGIMELIFMNS